MNPISDEDLKSTTAVRQITDEDIAFSMLLESHPILEKLVDRFDLCSVQTGDRFNITEKRMAIKPYRHIPTSEELVFLRKFADRILNAVENYERNENIVAKNKATKKRKKSPANTFRQMVEAMVVPRGSLADPNYFKDSTLRGNF